MSTSGALIATGSAVAVAGGGGLGGAGGSVGAGAGWQADIRKVNIKNRLLHQTMREYVIFIVLLIILTSNLTYAEQAHELCSPVDCIRIA
jgi:hypothetical protein